jgi:hypothetical protein
VRLVQKGQHARDRGAWRLTLGTDGRRVCVSERATGSEGTKDSLACRAYEQGPRVESRIPGLDRDAPIVVPLVTAISITHVGQSHEMTSTAHALVALDKLDGTQTTQRTRGIKKHTWTSQ